MKARGEGGLPRTVGLAAPLGGVLEAVHVLLEARVPALVVSLVEAVNFAFRWHLLQNKTILYKITMWNNGKSGPSPTAFSLCSGS